MGEASDESWATMMEKPPARIAGNLRRQVSCFQFVKAGDLLASSSTPEFPDFWRP